MRRVIAHTNRGDVVERTRILEDVEAVLMDGRASIRKRLREAQVRYAETARDFEAMQVEFSPDGFIRVVPSPESCAGTARDVAERALAVARLVEAWCQS